MVPINKFLPLPPDTDLSKPDAVVLLNDRLRRIVDQTTTPDPQAPGYSGTIVTAKLTGGGANGSQTFKDGRLIWQKAAT